MHLPYHPNRKLAIQMVVDSYQLVVCNLIARNLNIMRYLRLLLMMILMAGLTACEKEILLDEIAPDPLLVVNGIQHVGEPARLSVEKTSFYADSETDFRVKDVHVDLYVNGIFKEALQVRDSILVETYLVWDEWGEEHWEEHPRYAFVYCEGEYILCEGDALRFEVSSSEFDEVAVAETTIPYAPDVVSFDTVRIEADPDDYGLCTIYLSLTINDPAGNDYYNLYPQEGLSVGFESSDPVFADFMNIVHVDDLFGGSEYYGRGAYNMFNDTYFDGTQYPLSLKSTVYTDEAGVYYQPLVMEVTRVDYALYQFTKTYKAYDYNDDLLALFTEPTQVYSNVQNGVGVVCSQSRPVTMVVDLR